VNAVGILCPNASCKALLSLFSINSQIEGQIRRHLTKYYENWLLCDEPACAARTRQMNVYGKRCLITGCRGQMTQEYNDKMLYNQLLYFDMLFDIEKAKKKATDEDKGISSTCLINIRHYICTCRTESGEI
jgi:DNA polymerase alpha subunit A